MRTAPTKPPAATLVAEWVKAVAMAASMAVSMAVGMAASMLVSGGCTPDETPLNLVGFLPASAIEVRAEQAVAPRQCGPEAAQAFRYIALVVPAASAESATTNVISAGSFPCFSDALFTNLPREGSYTIAAFSFSKAVWEANRGELDGLSLTRAPFGEAAAALRKQSPVTSVSCTAKVTAGTRVVANCSPDPAK